MSCDNLCTAAKCAELELRISSLEAVISNLIDDLEIHKSRDIPTAHNYEPTVKLDVNYSNVTHDLNIRIQVDNAADFASTDVDPHTKSNLKLDGSFQNETLTLTVADGESQDSATITISKLEPDPPSVTVDVFELDNNQFAIKVGVDGEFDEDTFSISGEEHVKSNLKLDGSYQGEVLTLTVADGESYDSATIAIPLPDLVKNIVNNYYSTQGEEHVKSNLKLDGSYQGEILTLTVADGESYDTATIPIPNPNGGSSGVDGCFIDLKYENNLLTANLTIGQCFTQDSTKIMEFAPIDVEQITCENGVVKSEIVTVAVIKGTETAEIEAYAARAKIQKLQCESSNDVISIVASPKYVTNVDGKVLILHFVTFDNYPKRSRGSNYRQIQIPGAKETYDWKLDFENLVWQQGNQYAELELNEYRARVSGWFESEIAANAFFNQVLNLTIGTEKNRRYPKQKYPRTNIATTATRPYRAFIESINQSGQAICHVKYVPAIEENNGGN
jgi:hypothetical protein